MQKIKRETFIRMGTLALLLPFADSFWGRQAFAREWNETGDAGDFLKRLIKANDRQVEGLLNSSDTATINFNRKVGSDFAALASSYCSPQSRYYHQDLLLPKIETLIGVLNNNQTADGTVNIGNLESPPDTAFLVELVSAGAYILLKDHSTQLDNINQGIKSFLQKAGNALSTGGVHTPNHRWVICGALARLNHLYPDKKYTDRIEDWLGEGIFMDSDGHYPERSSGIYAGVENNSLITMARLLNKPALFDYVRKNLEMTYYYMEPNGDMVTNDSRRQDQYMNKSIVAYYYWHYRYMAIKDGNKMFAAITRQMESMKSYEEDVLNKGLVRVLEDDLLQQPLPASAPLPDNYEKFFVTSKLLRIRRGKTTATLFGGADWPLTIASGRSNSPNFFSCRKGNAILKYMRLSTAFFSMGYFYSDGIKKEGSTYILHKKIDVPYYQPLPKNLRNKAGDYALTPSIDNRFWNKMDFKNRPVSNVKSQETTIRFQETAIGFELDFSVTGLEGVPVSIELCFFEGGTLTGVTAGENGNSFLETGTGKYEYGGDSIQFGPGTVKHKTITALEGEMYSTHFGSLRTEGMHVYLTGTTPFKHKLTFG